MAPAAAAVLLAAQVASLDTDIYDQPPTTLLGCRCAGACTTSVLFECNDVPFCTVESEHCAKGRAPHSVTHGYYDYCVYEPYWAYEKLSAQQKQAIILDHVFEEKASGSYPSALNMFTGILGESVVVSFNTSSDVFPDGRTKYVHSVGVAGGIRFDSVGGHPYTGVFQGAEHGILRLSSATAPGSSGSTPSMGIKFLRTGRPSANVLAMHSLDGQPASDRDFFAHDWHNHVPVTGNFGMKMVGAKFWQASYCPLQVGISDLASSPTGRGTFPYMLSFHALVSSDCDVSDYAQCLANLAELRSGTRLFEVSATPSPGGKATLIGHISLTSPLTTSRFGDERLFFSHQLMEEDFALEPAWLAAIDRQGECGMGGAGTTAPPLSEGCNSPFNGTLREGVPFAAMPRLFPAQLAMLASDASFKVVA